VDCKIFAEVSAFSVMVKQLKNTALLDPESVEKTALFELQVTICHSSHCFVPVALNLQHNCREKANSNIGRFLPNFPTMVNSRILSSLAITTVMLTLIYDARNHELKIYDSHVHQTSFSPDIN